MSSPHPSELPTGRYRLPARPPVRLLLMASMSATVGSLEVIAWSVFRFPSFVLQAGVALIVVGVGLAVRALAVHRRSRWMLHVGPTSLTIVRGSRRQEIPWSTISAVRLLRSRLVIECVDGPVQHVLVVPSEAAGSAVLATMVEAIEAHLVPAG